MTVHGSLTENLRALGAARVFVVGDVLLDVRVFGSVGRVSPEAPVPIVLEDARSATLGGAANVAATVAAMGAEAHLAGRVGDDDEGGVVRLQCDVAGVRAHALVTSSTPTGRKTRVLAGYQQLLRIDRETIEPATPHEQATVLDAFRRFAEEGGGRCLVLSDYAKGMLAPELVRALIVESRERGIPVVVDPKAPTFEVYGGATVIKPNAAEGRAVLVRRDGSIAPASSGDDEDVAVCRAVLAESGSRNVVLSLSERGLLALGDDAPVPERRVSSTLSVADVSGAGDTMVAFLAMGLAGEVPFERALTLANLAAGIVCGKLGTATVSPAELMAVVSSSPRTDAAQKMLVSTDHVRWLSERLRAEGRRVAFANGCFDLLHAGHVAMLQRARSLTDVLVVGLNSDSSVTRLKGEGRPVQHVEDRAAVIAGLGCVDFVAVFEEDTPLELILNLRPDIIVKGGDYRPGDVVGGREAVEWGGRVEIVPLIQGLSTTRLIEEAARR